MFYYTVHDRFGSAAGEPWQQYVAWRGVPHLQEVVTLDLILCPSPLEDFTERDWDYNLHEDFKTHLFRDPDYLARRVSFDPKRHNLLAIADQLPPPEPIPEGFTFCGYDILDSDCSISVLLNCGRFPAIVAESELNRLGLLDRFQRAEAVATALRRSYPDDPHCGHCRVWLITRAVRMDWDQSGFNSKEIGSDRRQHIHECQ